MSQLGYTLYTFVKKAVSSLGTIYRLYIYNAVIFWLKINSGPGQLHDLDCLTNIQVLVSISGCKIDFDF